MAFDDKTRNRLQNFVSEARTLLSQEFTRQLQNDYGLDPTTGEISNIESLTFLDDTRRQTARLLRDVLEHYQASSPSSKSRESLERIVREQAFTILNRLCALRVAEARDILIESISNGYNSKGFQLYARVAGTAFGETGNAYRNYLFSIFDEFAMDLPVLFDRYSPMGRLFPRESVLLKLLEKINNIEIDPLWAEDETIGWMYQYFNSAEERRQMRNESQAPRNSRELAVRNQFFTPRYVVEFLTDNTLGRIWYEMTQGNTSLKETCRYFVRRPNEIFLAKGEDAPEQGKVTEDPGQQELLNQPVYIPFRPLKDPREIRMLDPACGSMHFGLYAFDLFEQIYNEAWDLENRLGDDLFERTGEFKPFIESYEDQETFLRDIPRLIIEYNIHGVDIDPRAVQIAGLSLWLRAQRSWKDKNIKLLDRPQIRKSNIVCAEPMPGEKDFLQDFTKNLKPRVLGQLVEIIFEKMELAGEAGSLLKIEEEIEDAVEKAREGFNKELLRRKQAKMSLFPELEKPKQTSLFDFADLPDRTEFWLTAEHKILNALRNYAEQAETKDGSRRQLFVKDAARGFAFIDLCRKHYDVVLMNPPFGEFSKQWKAKARATYPNSYNDILGAFVERHLHCLVPHGRIGAITSRTCFFLTTFSKWRENIVLDNSALCLIADLGQGVMDEAMVEAAAYVIERTAPLNITVVFRAIAEKDRQGAVESCIDACCAGKPDLRNFITDQSFFSLLPDSPFVYWIDKKIIQLLSSKQRFEPNIGHVRQGLSTGDDPRFVRTVWEVPYEDTQFCYYPSNGEAYCRFDDPIVMAYFKRRKIGKPVWAFHVKSGASQPWYSPITIKINYAKDGSELRSFTNAKGKQRSVLRNVQFYYKPGFSWTRRAVRFYPYIVPGNCIPSASRYMAFPEYENQIEAIGVCASRIASACLRFKGEKFEWPNFLVENVKMLPWPEVPEETNHLFKVIINREVDQRRVAYQNHEPFHEFIVPAKIQDMSRGGQALAFNPTSLLGEEGERLVAEAYGLTPHQTLAMERDLLEAISFQSQRNGTDKEDNDEEAQDNDFVIDTSSKATEEACLSYLIGTILGRWDIRYATTEKPLPELPQPLDPLPVCPPGMFQNAEGLPANPKDVAVDYPLSISWPGIIVDDEGHQDDIIDRIRDAIETIWKHKAGEIEQESCEILGVNLLREYFNKPNKFFADHLNRYSKSRRQAPIYWPLSTSSSSYTLWIYYHRLTDQILYTCINDFVEPKLKQISEKANNLRQKTSRNHQEEKEMEKLTDFEVELKDFRDELLRIAKFWKPNLNDGVQITAAPLWKLFQHKPWQKNLKETWKKLEKGDYDWSHLAYSIWPDRVIRASHKDRSYAIAHDLESDLWEEIENGTDRQGNPKYKWVPKDLSEQALKAIIMEKSKGKT